MRTAVISDIHGNLVSLETVLNVLETEGVNDIVCLGDITATGPQPKQVIERIRSLKIPVVMGNADAWLISPTPIDVTDENAERIVELDRWCREQLTPPDVEYLNRFPLTKDLTLADGLKMFCCHGSPRSNTDRIFATTDISTLQNMLSGVREDIVACGHTHIQMLRRHMNQVIVNPGSVGMPYDVIPDSSGVNSEGGRIWNPPWAEYAIVTTGSLGLQVEFRRTPINLEALIQAAYDSEMPNPEWWTKGWRQTQ